MLTPDSPYQERFAALNQKLRWEVADELRRANLARVNELHPPVTPRDSFYTRHGKRALDVAVSGAALLLSSPVVGALCLVTLKDLGRPVLFTQERPGQHGKMFRMVKLRTMREAYDDQGRPLLGELRVTKAGRLIRRASLDELLNFWNIFTGDMSLIGPRPLVPEYVERFSRRHRQRMAVKPGLECPPPRPPKGPVTYNDQFENDCWYVENVSLKTDAWLIWRVLQTALDRRQNKARGSSTRGSFMGYDADGTVITTVALPDWALNTVLKRHGLLTSNSADARQGGVIMDLDARPLAGRKLLLLDGSRKSIEIVDEAHRLGVHVIVTDYNAPEQSPAKLAADQHFEVSTSDVDAVVELIRREGVDGVLAGFSDRWLATYAEICAAAQVPCYATVDQIRLFTDKKRYKALLEQFGVPTITGYSVEDATSGAIPEEAFPLIVKPADGSGSRGISVVASQSELQSGLDVALDYSWTQELVIERFLPGQEATVYWVFQDGDCRVSLMWHRHMHDFGPQDRYRLPVAYSSPSSLLPTYLADVAPSVQAMMRSAGVRDGIMFMQGLIHEGVFHTYDIGYRVTPTQEYRVVEELCGYNPLSMLIHFALTGTMGEPDLAAVAEPRHHGYGFNISTLIRPGTVGSVTGLDDVAALPGILSTVAAIDAGETLPEEGWGQLRQVAVRTVGVADSLDSLRQTMRRVDELIDVRDVDGASMVIHPDMPPQDLDSCVL